MGPKPRTYTHAGHSRTVREWAQALGLSLETMRRRIDEWGIERAVETPVHEGRQRGALQAHERTGKRRLARLNLSDAEMQALAELKAEREQLLRRLKHLTDSALAAKFELSRAQVKRL